MAIHPQLIDLQINGFAGVDFQRDDVTAEELLRACRAIRKAGCSQFLLTLITDRWDALANRLRAFCRLRKENPELQSAIAGWHIEGPFLSTEPGYSGAHPAELMMDPSPALVQELKEMAGADPLLLTLAPERSGSMESIHRAVSLGMPVALGHTNASAAVLREAVEAGATLFTHLGNGCPRELDRHDNIVWRVLETDGLTVSVIPDGIHVSPPLFRLIHRVLGRERVCYVSDAMSAAGVAPGRYTLGRMELQVGADQVVRQPGSPLFAGSALEPAKGLRRAAEMLGCGLEDVLPAYTDIPARVIGLPDNQR